MPGSFCWGILSKKKCLNLANGLIMRQIIFAGGIHGVGKSTLCRDIASALSIGYLSASELLKWNDINDDIKNKKVLDIPDTQRRLLEGLQTNVDSGGRYILDGHFCLFNMEGLVIPVPITTFELIDPICLILVTGDVTDIQAALEKRDERAYDNIKLFELQEKEIFHAQEIATHLNISLFHFKKQETSAKELIAQIHESLT
jgi:adenylate kinase